MPDYIKIGSSIEVFERNTPKWIGQRRADGASCDVVQILDRDCGFVVVDTGSEYRIAKWHGSDDQVFRF